MVKKYSVISESFSFHHEILRTYFVTQSQAHNTVSHETAVVQPGFGSQIWCKTQVNLPNLQLLKPESKRKTGETENRTETTGLKHLLISRSISVFKVRSA